MKLSPVKINVRDAIGNLKMIPWKGHIVGGTQKTFAVTRAAQAVGNKFEPSRSLWNVTHLPTGRTHHRLASARLSAALKKARRLHRIFAKHGISHTTDLEKIKAAKIDVIKVFG